MDWSFRMATTNQPNTPPPTPSADPNADWTAKEKAWFEKNGVTDDKEKEAIRGRARVLAYDRERSKFETESNTPPPAPVKKWWQD
jgi:hypothetical protein